MTQTAWFIRHRRLLIAMGLGILFGVYVIYLCNYRDDIAFLSHDARAEWIIYDSPMRPFALPVVPLETKFRTSFILRKQPTAAKLVIRAFKSLSLRINGVTLINPRGGETSWKRAAELDVAQWLHAGDNELEAVLTNSDGPPALWLVLNTPDTSVRTDRLWQASYAGATWKNAALATDSRPQIEFDSYRLARTPAQGIAVVWPLWLAFAFVGVFVAWSARIVIAREGPIRTGATLQTNWQIWMIVAVTAFMWFLLALHNLAYVARWIGFDFSVHLEYINYILKYGSLPLANQGMETHHPPLYYILAATLLRIGHWPINTFSGLRALRLFNTTLYVINLILLGGCLKLIFPNNARPQIFGLIFAGSLSPYLYLMHFPVNENLLICLACPIVYLTLRILLDTRPSFLIYGLLGLAMGGAMLTKVSAFGLLLPVFAILGAKLLMTCRQATTGRLLSGLAVCVLVAVATCSWYCVTIYKHFGTPFVTDFGDVRDSSIRNAWCQDPGFRTSASFRRFGQVFVQPFHAALGSIPDSLYATMWGDALRSDTVPIESAPPWNFNLIVAGYVLAIIPTLAIILGAIRMLLGSNRTPSWASALLLGLFCFAGALVLLICLKAPIHSIQKATYALFASVPLCAFFGLGFHELTRRWRFSRVIAAAFMGILALNAYCSFWVRPPIFRNAAKHGNGASE